MGCFIFWLYSLHIFTLYTPYSMELAHKSLLELTELIKNRKTTSQEVWEYFLNRTQKYNPELNAFNTIHEDGFHSSDNTLLWLPLWVKDIFCEKWRLTTGASKMLADFVTPYDATLIEHLTHAWMSSMGKCNMDEFAMGSSWENSAFWPTLNPHGTNRIPGGSSSWSAAAVAAWLVPASLWTDTGWSIRQPASMCGIVGFKPSYGRNSRFWVMPMASSLDCPGTFTTTVRDAGLLYDIMNGEDKNESTTIEWKHTLNPQIWERINLKWIKVWVPKEYFETGLDAWVKKEIENALEEMKILGAEIIEVSLPMTQYAVAAYYVLCPAEVTTNLARLDGIRYGHNSKQENNGVDDIYLHNRGEGLWSEPQRRSILWSYVLSAWFFDAYFKKAAQARTLIIEDFKKVFEQVDILVGPVAPNVAWKIWENIDDPIKMYLEDAYTIPASLAGLPGISIPCGFALSHDAEKELLPVWLQLLAPRLQEEKLLEVAHVLEKALNLREKMIPEKYRV